MLSFYRVIDFYLIRLSLQHRYKCLLGDKPSSIFLLTYLIYL